MSFGSNFILGREEKMIEHYFIPATLGASYLEYKLRAMEARGYRIVRVVLDASIRGGTEIGWDIQAENRRKPLRSIIANEAIKEI